jgi:hypothetical protein
MEKETQSSHAPPKKLTAISSFIVSGRTATPLPASMFFWFFSDLRVICRLEAAR